MKIEMGSEDALPYGPDPDVDYYLVEVRSSSSADGQEWGYRQIVTRHLCEDGMMNGWEFLYLLTGQMTHELRRHGAEPGEWTVWGGWFPRSVTEFVEDHAS